MSSPPASVITKQYITCIGKLATITIDYFKRPAGSAILGEKLKTDFGARVHTSEKLVDDLSKIFKKYHGVLHLVHNTKGLHEKTTRRTRILDPLQVKRKVNFGAFARARPPTPPPSPSPPRIAPAPRPQHPHSLRDRSQLAARRAETFDPSPPARAIINLNEVKLFMNGTRPTPQHQENVEVYNFSDSTSPFARQQGWNNTFAQNDNGIGATANPTRFQKEQCRCSLCGSYMYVADSGPGNPGWGCNTATVQLEHHIPASRAVEIYADVWKSASKDVKKIVDPRKRSRGEESPIRINNSNLQQYEQAFFRSIGGANATVQNMFTYTCALCNQVKTNLKPYMEEDNGNLVVNQECLEAFDNRLCEIFIEFVSNPSQEILNWIRTTPPDRQINNCAITQHRTCMHIWVCQIITTFIVPQNITNGTFVSAHIYQHIHAYKTRKQQDQRTDLQMWHYYVRPAMRGVLSQKLRNVPPRPPPPLPLATPPRVVAEQYFGRPVYDNGVTIPRDAQPPMPDYQSIIQKFEGILDYMKRRVERLRE